MKFVSGRKLKRILFRVVCMVTSFTLLFIARSNFTRNDIRDIDTEPTTTEYYIFNDIGSPLDLKREHIDSKKAFHISRKVRVLCWIMTSPNNLATKAMAVKNTWAQRCNKFIFFSSVNDTSFPVIKLNVSEGRQHLTGKTVKAFRYCYKHYRNQFDWFLKADDDTYVIVENLRYFLSHHNSKKLLYFGHKFKVHVKSGYFSGGAGYVLSRAALFRLVLVGMRNPFICRQDGGSEDVEIGKCMEKLDITAGESLDKHGRETFHPYFPLAHVKGTHPKWLFHWSAYEPKKGLDCCSEYSISFHYMSPNDMYLTHYLLYHLRTHGISEYINNDIMFNSTIEKSKNKT